MAIYCNCAWEDPDGTYNAGEPCEIHPKVVLPYEPNPFTSEGRAYAELAAECSRLRGTLSLAEEGLANYAQENERLRKALSARLQELEAIKQERLTWAMYCECTCKFCERLSSVIRGAVPQTQLQSEKT